MKTKQQYQCPECGKMLLRMGLGPHRAKAHGVHGAGSTLKVLEVMESSVNHDLENALAQIVSEPEAVIAHIDLHIKTRLQEVKLAEQQVHHLRQGILRLEHLRDALLKEPKVPFRAENFVGKAS